MQFVRNILNELKRIFFGNELFPPDHLIYTDLIILNRYHSWCVIHLILPIKVHSIKGFL